MPIFNQYVGILLNKSKISFYHTSNNSICFTTNFFVIEWLLLLTLLHKKIFHSTKITKRYKIMKRNYEEKIQPTAQVG